MYGLGEIDFGAIERAQDPSLEQEAARAIRLAKVGTVAITILQAIAAFSALGMVAITYANYRDGKKTRRSSRRR